MGHDIETTPCFDFESMLEEHVGGWGRYQWRILGIFTIVALELSYVTFAPVLYLYVPKSHWCSAPPELSNLSLNESLPLFSPFYFDDVNDVIRPSQCQMYDVNYTQVLELYLFGNLTTGNASWPKKDCQHGWMFDLEEYFQTAATDMSWVCNSEWKSSFSQSLFSAGATIGTLFFGWVSDHLGRFKCMLLSHLILLVTGILTPISISWGESAFFAIRFLCGLSFNTFLISYYMLALEYVSNDKRAIVGNLSLAIWLTAGSVVQPWLIKAIGDWKIFHHFLFAQVGLIFLSPLFLHESCRWLISQGKIDESVKILKQIAQINQRKVDELVFGQFEAYAVQLKEECHVERSYTWLDLFKTPRLRRNTLLMMVTWMLTSLVFDGQVRNISNLNYSIYVTFTLTVAMELPADLVSMWALNNIGRRWTAAGSLLLSSLAMIICAFCLSDEIVSLVSAVVGRFFVTIAMTAGIQISMEVVPTQLRGQGSGLANVAAQASTFFSPYVVYSASAWQPLPFCLFALVGMLAATAAVFLPETAGADLPNTIDEAEFFGMNQPFFNIVGLRKKHKK